MPLSWNEIRNRALEFYKRWENETSEDAEAKPFWTELLNINLPRFMHRFYVI